MFCIITSSIAWSQDLYVGGAGSVTITPSAHVYAGSNVDVITGGSLTAESDGTNSSSFITAGTATGNVTYKRYVIGDTDAGTVGTNWHLVSAPVGEEDAATFGANAANDVSVSGTKYAVAYYKNDNAQGTHTVPSTRWVYYTDAETENFVRGEGYSTHRESNGVFTFTGEMDDASVTIPMATVSGPHFWFCVGNPYPSFLSTTAVYADNTAILDATTYNALYIWDGATYLPKNNVSTGEYLAPGQGFMVMAKSNSETFTFNETSQTPQVGASDNFERAAPTPNVVVSLSNGTAVANTELKYFSNTTSGLDVGWDAGTFRVGSTNFSIDTHLANNSAGDDFVLQCLSDSDYETTVVPLAVKAVANQKITFTAAANSLPAGLKVYLEDRVAGTYTDISTNAYEVTPTVALEGIGRFYLYTTASVLSVDNPSTIANSLNVYKSSNTSITVAGLRAEGNATLKMYSVTGKEVFAKQFVAESKSDINIPRLSTGVYIVNVVSNNVELNKKVIID